MHRRGPASCPSVSACRGVRVEEAQVSRAPFPCALLCRREVSASAAGPLLSACFPAQERVAGVLLDAFARVLDAQRGAALLGVPEAHPGLAGEYEGTRRALIDRLMGEALEGAGSEEEALQRLSWPVALAKRHAAYSSLFDLCWLRLQNRGMLLSLMVRHALSCAGVTPKECCVALAGVAVLCWAVQGAPTHGSSLAPHSAWSPTCALLFCCLPSVASCAGMAWRQMELSETHHRDRFTRYVFSRLLHAQQLQALVHLGPQFPLELREFLTVSTTSAPPPPYAYCMSPATRLILLAKPFPLQGQCQVAVARGLCVWFFHALF